MYSALKVNGKKLYELAREGKVIERKARPVKILDIQILEIDLPKVRMEVSCSKGTYIRTLCHDIGEKLGCGGCMESLIRTRVSTFRLEDAKTLDGIETLKQEGKLAELLEADMLVILTSVDNVCLDYGTENERPLSSMTVAEAKKYMEQGQFGEGDMQPKIQAAIDFIGDSAIRSVLITKLHVDGSQVTPGMGTMITK